MSIGKWILAAIAVLFVFAYFHEHHLADYYKVKAWIKVVVKSW